MLCRLQFVNYKRSSLSKKAALVKVSMDDIVMQFLEKDKSIFWYSHTINLIYPELKKEGVMYAFKNIDRLCSTNRSLSCEKRQLVQSKELSEQLHIPQGYVLKVASILKEAQILEAVTGIDGGFRLVKHPRDIPIYDVIRAMETTMQINRCLEKLTVTAVEMPVPFARSVIFMKRYSRIWITCCYQQAYRSF